MISQDFLKVQNYLTSLIPVEPKKVDLENIKYFLGLLGNPEQKFASVHVGGTAGKGSAAFLISSLLSSAGYKVGLHLSPHLEVVTERMQINGHLISQKRFCDLVSRLRGKAEEMKRKKGACPSYFEFLVAAAFVYFAEEKVDLAVVEVGLGGKLDGTNVLNPLVSVITNVEKDHTEILGKTLLKIAQDKAGIIKEGKTVVSAMTQTRVRDLIEKVSQEKRAKLLLADRDFTFKIKRTDEKGETFDLKTPQNFYSDLSLSLLGNYQVKNASLAIVVCEELKKFNFHLPEEVLRTTLSQVRFAGRLEKVESQPLVFLDGAHNPAKMRSLIGSLQKIFPQKKVLSVVAIKKGKDIKNMLKSLVKITRLFIFTTFQIETDTGQSGTNASSPKEISQALFAKAPFLIEPCAKKAVQKALKIARQDDLVLITGSLYLVGEVRDLWYSQKEVLAKQTMFPQSEAGNDFPHQVYDVAKKIPKGKVTTYGRIAKILGKSGAARAVGQALGKNPCAPIIPCHRVVASNGHLCGFAQGLKAKEKLLEKEGVKVVNSRVDLRKHLW